MDTSGLNTSYTPSVSSRGSHKSLHTAMSESICEYNDVDWERGGCPVGVEGNRVPGRASDLRIIRPVCSYGAEVHTLFTLLLPFPRGSCLLPLQVLVTSVCEADLTQVIHRFDKLARF